MSTTEKHTRKTDNYTEYWLHLHLQLLSRRNLLYNLTQMIN